MRALLKLGGLSWTGMAVVFAIAVGGCENRSADDVSVASSALTTLSRTGWVATASNTGGTDVPAHALDGQTTTRWSTGKAMANGMYFQVDMQTAVSFNQITMDSAGSKSDYARAYQVLVSNDGVTFSAPVATGMGTAPLITVSFANQTARFIKVVQTGAASNWWSIAEFNVYSAGSCPALAAPTNGSVSAPTLTAGSTATYSCGNGYVLVGAATRTCQTDGTWSGTAATCAPIDCGAPTSPTNGTVSAPATTYGSNATYVCNAGFQLSGSATRTCQSNGTWSGSMPTCSAGSCGALAAPTNGTVSAPTTTVGATATYSCNSGFVLSGAATRTCRSDDTWSGSAPTCVAGTCAVPTAPANGSVSAPTLTVGSTATFSCNAGFNLTGSSSETCQSNGTWSGSTPTCVPRDCGAPSSPPNGSVAAPTTTTGSAATYSCNAGYALSGSATRTCQTDGTWSGAAPTCVVPSCGTPPAPANGTCSSCATTAVYSCAAGYALSGASVRTCQSDGTWSGASPSCVLVDCGALPGPANGSVSAPTTTYGSTATYSCSSGFTLAGSATRVCQASGAWSNPAPTCQ
jgi:CUB/sushi domain-containing protein